MNFMDRVDASGECWIWKGAVSSTGYGNLRAEGNTISAHRQSYKLHRGEIGDNVVCHSCDNKLCVNPEHLFLGSQRDNIQDMVAKGRGAKMHTADTVFAARALYAMGVRQMTIASMLSVPQQTISRWGRGITRAELKVKENQI